ncbi:hemerythrin domain-containing protein [Neisseria arctica]|uniref:hemerythrin domain-containing protein n=1 Tax=Neisseria arctica TaxID=1470200 RepID=UPI0039C85958
MTPAGQTSTTFAEPVEMLYACHEKVRRFCNDINLLPQHIAEKGYDAVAVQAVRQIIRYFTQAAPLHHQDEEEDFFPLLVQYAPQTQNDINLLLQQHESLHLNWLALTAEFEKLTGDTPYLPNEEILRRFTRAYKQHLALEEPLFELGKKFIPVEQLTIIGEKMAARRRQA